MGEGAWGVPGRTVSGRESGKGRCVYIGMEDSDTCCGRKQPRRQEMEWIGE